LVVVGGLFTGVAGARLAAGGFKENVVTNAIWASTVLWAQQSGAAASGDAKPTAEAQGVPQGAPAGQAPQGGLFGGGWSTIIMLVLMVAVFYFLLIRPQQKKTKEHQKMIDAIGKGTEIVTNGGLIGRVTAVTGKTLTMEISEKVRVRVLRSQVAGIFDSTETEKK
jgi:preprotein translocase subunit YajC